MALTAAFVALAGVAFARANTLPPIIAAAPVPPMTATSGDGIDVDSLYDAGTRVIDNNPFRLNRLPPVVRVGDAVVASPATPPAPATPARPTLTLRAVAGGPPWSAIIEGMPDTPGPVVVREGDRVGALAIMRIWRDTVRVVARDTSWSLTLKRSQQ